MKKFLPAIVIAFLFLSSSMTVFAQNTPSSTSARERLLMQKSIQSGQASGQAPVVNAVRTAVQNMKEKIASREAVLKAKLDKFRDQNRAEIAQRISSNLNQVNSNRTEQMSNNLKIMNSIMSKLEGTISEAVIGGKDTASASAELSNARTAINTAQAMVDEQSQKIYTVDVTNENMLKKDVKAKRDELFKDLSDTRTLLLNARETLVKTIFEVKLIAGNI